MDLMQLFDSRRLIIKAVLILLVFTQCKSAEAIQDAIDEVSDQSTVDEQLEAHSSGEDIPASSDSNPVLVTYRNSSSNITISLDPDVDQFYLDLRGMAPSEKDSIIVMDTTVIQNRATDIQSLLSSFRKAQDLFYLGEYRDALTEIDKTIDIQETADAYALDPLQ